MNKIWIVAEQLNNKSSRCRKVIQSAEEPTDEFRKAIIETFESYKDNGIKIPNTTVSLFMPFDENGSNLLAQAAPYQIDTVFESLKSSGRTGLCDIVSIQRSAWCHTQNIDILEYSFQNGGGRGTKRLAIVNNKDFQTFRKKMCEIEE